MNPEPTEFADRHCTPCEGGVSPLTKEEAQRYLDRLASHWRLSPDTKSIFRDFEFKGFNKTMGFANAVAWIANKEGHHPDLEIGFKHCLVRYTTHAINGLSENDFICALKIDNLMK